MEVALDSGCVEHVCDRSDAPGTEVTESPGSKRGQNFIVGNGEKVLNQGEMKLQMEAELDDKHVNTIDSVFQVAKVTRPLMSVSKICDGGFTAHVDDQRAVIKDKSGSIVCIFQRRGGLCVCKMRLKSPFTRRGA